MRDRRGYGENGMCKPGVLRGRPTDRWLGSRRLALSSTVGFHDRIDIYCFCGMKVPIDIPSERDGEAANLYACLSSVTITNRDVISRFYLPPLMLRTAERAA